MRAVILPVHSDNLGRIPRFLPPEHRIRADKEVAKVTELIIEGPMLPEVVDGVFGRADLDLTVTFAEDFVGCSLWAFWRFEDGAKLSKVWKVGAWPSHAELMEFMR